MPASAAIVAISKWRSQSGELCSTVVGKLTLEVSALGGASLIAPEPLIERDRIALNGRHVLEASELMPWTAAASVVAYGGPLRFTLERDSGAPRLIVSASAKSPAGYSTSSDERAPFAVEKPIRGSDGLWAIPSSVDGRYFVAAPRVHQVDSIRGDEAFYLELTGMGLRARLPGLVIVVTLQCATAQRAVALTPDMITIDGKTKHISLISRALVASDAAVLAHAVVPMSELRGTDRGDPMTYESPEETHDISEAELERMRAEEASVDSSLAGAASQPNPLPATPFDPGFVAGLVLPASDASTTLTSTQETAGTLEMLRKQLRGERPTDTDDTRDESTSDFDEDSRATMTRE